MDLNSWLIIAATILGPILAVQAQKFVERIRSSFEVKKSVFQRLMATRGARLTPDHVSALNMIDLAFYGKGPGKRRSTEQAVLEAWKIYLDRLAIQQNENTNEQEQRGIDERRSSAFVDLLTAMSKDVGYAFDRIQIEKGGYHPIAHGQQYERGMAAQELLVKVLSGERALRVEQDYKELERIQKEHADIFVKAMGRHM